MFGIGLPEMILILALALIVVGPDKLPELARSVAKGVLELKKTVSTLKENLDEENPFDSVKPELEEVSKSLKEKLGDPAADGWKGILPEEGVNSSLVTVDGDVEDIIEGEIVDTSTAEPAKSKTSISPHPSESADTAVTDYENALDNDPTENSDDIDGEPSPKSPA